MFGIAPWRKPEAAYPLTMREEFKTLFDRVFGNWPMAFEPEENFWNLNMEETEKEVLVRAEVPGFEPEEFEVSVHGERLLIKAEHKVEEKEKKVGRTYGHLRYERYMTLPAPVEVAKAEALYRNGILELKLPKTEEAKPHKIEVKK